MTTPTTTAEATELPAWQLPTVVLIGGPLDRRWYRREDLEQLQRSAHHFAEIRRRCDVPIDTVLAYAGTDRTLANPTDKHGPGQVWAYTAQTPDRPVHSRGPNRMTKRPASATPTETPQ